jgi:hypothetical protein
MLIRKGVIERVDRKRRSTFRRRTPWWTRGRSALPDLSTPHTPIFRQRASMSMKARRWSELRADRAAEVESGPRFKGAASNRIVSDRLPRSQWFRGRMTTIEAKSGYGPSLESELKTAGGS